MHGEVCRNVRNVPSDMFTQRRFRSACAFAQSDKSLRWANLRKPRMQSFLMRKTKPAEADLSFRWAHMSEGTISHVAAQIELKRVVYSNY